MKEHTAESFSKALGVEKDRGYGFLRFLEAAGAIENLGVAPKAEKARGKGPILYRVNPDTVITAITKMMEAL